MIIYILFGHRKERYPGEYAPEVLASTDEYCNEDNPGYLVSEKNKCLRSGEFESLTVIPVSIDGAEVMRRLHPENKTMEGKIV